MKITYDVETDSMTIVLRDETISDSDEVSQNVIADYVAAGEIVSFEVLQASRVVSDTEQVLFERHD
jgi:uncharacterized protein YuzE